MVNRSRTYYWESNSIENADELVPRVSDDGGARDPDATVTWTILTRNDTDLRLPVYNLCYSRLTP